MIGQMVGQYRITQKLGEGGMGTVYRAVDTMIDREVAIKMLRPEIARRPDLLLRFRAEAVTVARLNHAGIATLYNFTQDGDDFFMVMEYVPGKTLEEVERERGALPWTIAVPLFQKILDAVQPAHDGGILHRDIKPANVMLTTWGAIKVMDFGIARMLGTARMTREGAMVGTIEYVPPERVQGKESDARGDIYSLGIVLYEMLCGRLPFQSDGEYELMRCHVHTPLPSFQQFGVDVPPEIENVVRKATAKSPDERFDNCEEFAQALQSASGNLTLGKKAILDLVGAVTVQQLGTAGHVTPPGGTVPVSGHTPGPTPNAVPQAPVAPASEFGCPVPRPSFAASIFPISYLRAHWKAASAVAVLLSILAGLVIGMVARHGAQAESATVQEGVQHTLPPSPPPAQMPPAVPAPSPAPAMLTEQPVAEPNAAMPNAAVPVIFPAGPEEKKPAHAKKNDDLHQKSLKALDQ